MSPARTGSWPVLLAAAAAFVALFFVLRHRSSFLAIESQTDAAAAIAQLHHLSVADVRALRDLVGGSAPVADWQTAAATFAAGRGRLGDGLAAVAASGDSAAAEAALRVANGPDAAWLAFRGEPAALPGVRFLAMRERFAERAARD